MSERKVGTALIFTRAGSAWIQQGGALTGTGEVGGGEFGSGVALSGDGNTALVGGRGDDGEVGAAWVFRRSGATWTQDGEKLYWHRGGRQRLWRRGRSYLKMEAQHWSVEN